MPPSTGGCLRASSPPGIYCLPSCPARKPLARNVRFFADETAALAGAAGVGLTKLKALFRDHAHTQPSAFLQRARIQAACARLESSATPLLDLGATVGFESPSGFHEAFRRQTGLAPGACRDLLGSDRFVLPLPEHTRVDDLLRYHGRDPESVSTC